MKKIKTLVAIFMAFALVLVVGQFSGVSEVYAASGASISVKNAQLATNLPQELKNELNSSGVSDLKVYVANYSTVVDVTVNSGDALVFYAMSNVTNDVQEDKVNEVIKESKRLNIGAVMQSGPANVGCVLISSSSFQSGILIYSQAIAKSMGIAVEGTRTDNYNCTMNRLYNPNSGEHFYTANDAEKNNLVSLGWQYEGTGWTAPAYSGTPVYRLYNPNAGDHHYTTNAGERANLISLGWSDEGIGWYSDELGTTTLHRLYNPNATGAGAHHYTVNAAEATNLQNLGWRYEGTAWFGL